MALSLSPSQAFVQDPEGKTHVLLFHPQDSIAKNLLCHSSQLHILPLVELYILSGSHIIQADRTGIENGLHHEPHSRILLRCRGGMRAGLRGSAYGSCGGKGRGYRAPDGDARGMGGPPANVENSHTTPPIRAGRGRGRGNRFVEPKRPTMIHTQAQETMDDNSLNALLKAKEETHRTKTILYCRQRWEASETIIGYGPPPPPLPRRGILMTDLRNKESPLHLDRLY